MKKLIALLTLLLIIAGGAIASAQDMLPYPSDMTGLRSRP